MSRLKYSFSLLIKSVIKMYLLRVYKVNYVFGNISIKKNEPFFLIGNHVLLLDALFSSFVIKGYAVPVVNSFVYTNKLQRIALTKFSDSIVKRKGQSDIQTIKEIRKYVRKGRPIAIYPEGNASYYGETIESIYATAKLLKLQKIAVISVKTKGGYFAKPRWRDKRIDRAYLELETSQLFTAEEIKELSVEEIYVRMTESYYQNDYEWNKIEKIKYIGDGRLEGVHRVIYGCPECKSIKQIKSDGDTIYCSNCGMKGIVNDFGFIENTKFDNFIEWGHFQETILKDNLNIEFDLNIELFKYDLKVFKRSSLGKMNLKYTYGKFSITSKDFNKVFTIKDIKGEVYSEALDFSFDYKDETFMFRNENPKLLLDLTKFNKEE